MSADFLDKQRTTISVSGRSSLEVAGRPCSATKRSRWPCPLRSAAPSHARPMVPAQAVNGWRDDGQLGPGLLNHPGERAPSQNPRAPDSPPLPASDDASLARAV